MAVEVLWLKSSPWHAFLLTIVFCFINLAIIVSIRFLSAFEAPDFIICLNIASISGHLFFSVIAPMAAKSFHLKYKKIVFVVLR